jgi:hypothetical protein
MVLPSAASAIAWRRLPAPLSSEVVAVIVPARHARQQHGPYQRQRQHSHQAEK